MRSIRSRTLLLVLGVLSITLSLISFLSYRDAQHEVRDLFDAELAQQARLLAGLIGSDLSPVGREILQQALDEAITQGGDGDEAHALGHKYESKLAFMVIDQDGKRLLQSARAPIGALQPLLAHNAAAGQPTTMLHDGLAGYHSVTVEGREWRMFLLEDRRDQQWVLVGEREDVRGELVGNVTLRSLMPDLVGLPVLSVLVWLAIGWGLRPLGRMVHVLKSRDPDTLTPLQLEQVPHELAPMVESLDRLLLQVNELLERERRFLAYAAHELRTPLAVLRIHAQNALQSPDPHDREDALRQLESGIDRATRIVAQLLTLARLEPNAVSPRMADLDLLALTRQELAELIPLALERDQELTLEADEHGDFRLHADAAALGTLLQNLVGNAVHHTPIGGQIQVRVDADSNGLTLRVQDSGPGVAPALRHKVFERFYREGAGQGAGLGLSIVARIVELHQGSIELGDSPFGGLEAIVRLPRKGTEPRPPC